MSTKPIHTFARYKVKSGNLPTVLEMVEELRVNSTKEAGNLFYKVYEDRTNPCTLILHEGYVDEAALTAHRNSRYYISTVVEKMPTLLDEREVFLTTPLED